MSARTVSLDQRLRFEAWLSADSQHERTYQAQKMAWSAVARMPHLLDEASSASNSALSKLADASKFRYWDQRARFSAIAAALVLITIGVYFWNQFPPFKAGETYETTVAQVKDVKLSDDTLVTLGASSQIDVDFTHDERRVVLTRGEAFFEVTRDTARPFFVTAGSTLIRVVGTKFDVHYGPRAVRVAVAEGRVEVMKVGENASPSPRYQDIQVLTAGEAALAESSSQVVTSDTVNKEDLGAWRSGRLVYVDARLRDVVADINRYYDGKIEVADEATGDTQLTTAFRVDQIDRMLEVLQGAIPVNASHTSDGRIVISMKPAER